MAVKTFAAIYIGSYEVNLKVFEISERRQLRTIDHVRSRIELGRDAYSKGILGYESVEDLCQVLKEFRRIMDGYQVDDYAAYASAVLHSVSNELFVLDQIRLRTKLHVQILSNSEQRFTSYKALAFRPAFEQMIKKGAAVVDIGGGSIQITLFWQGKVITTQQIVLGIMRIREKLSQIKSMVSHYEEQIQEMIDKELEIFRRLYLKDRELSYVIMIGDYIYDIMQGTEHRSEDDTIPGEQFKKTLKKLQKKDPQDMAQSLGLHQEQDPLLLPSVVLYKRLAEELAADSIWVPGVNISDGIAYDYAQKNKMLKQVHDFEEDIRSAACSLAERYKGYSNHTKAIHEMVNVIFDAMKSVHGMGKRQRLLLECAAILHDCGRYMSLANQAQCSYEIIMASEIMGMTHLEREIVANTVKYNASPLVPYDELQDKMDQESYMVVAKLAAILKIANAMDRSHKQKFRKVRAALKDRQLIITVDAWENLVLEKGLFEVYADAFERVFSVKPMIREKRVLN